MFEGPAGYMADVMAMPARDDGNGTNILVAVNVETQ